MKELTHKGIIFNIKSLEVISNRNITTNPGLVTVARSYSSNSKNGDKPCKPVEKKCVRNQPCPKFVLPDCPPSKGSDCAHLYRDVSEKFLTLFAFFHRTFHCSPTARRRWRRTRVTANCALIVWKTIRRSASSAPGRGVGTSRT